MKCRWAALLLAVVPALAADPVRVVIVTRSSQLLPQALERFESVHGKGLVDLRYGDGVTSPLPLAQANITLFYYGGQDDPLCAVPVEKVACAIFASVGQQAGDANAVFVVFDLV